MLVQSLLNKFVYVVENTRKFLKSISDSALSFKPAKNSWSTAQFASHIAQVYNWYHPTLYQRVFKLSTYTYDKGDITTTANIIAKFEENVKNAQAYFRKCNR